MMTDSHKLLAQYAANGSESAFRALVERYINLVYSTALRLVGGDTQLAQDVTQTVFISLARKARAFSSDVMLGGWLYQNTYHTATKAVRSQRRRQSREREAVEMNTLQNDAEAHWQQIAPVLDEAITGLEKKDRTAILLRFFEQLDFRSVGEALGSNEDAARMRVNRALEKLHTLLKERGVTMPMVALGTVLTLKTVTAAPVGLVAIVSNGALAGITGTGIAFTVLRFVTATQFKLSVSALVVAGAVTTLVVQHRTQMELRRENESLHRQIAQLNADNANLSDYLAHVKTRRAPRLPAPPMQAASLPSASPAENLQSTNLYALFGSNELKLTAAQVESYLKANRTNAASLLAAYRTSGDLALLKEAMEKYPDDPQVDFEAALQEGASPAEQRYWLNAFKQSAPDNALPNYLSALNYFKVGQVDQAVQELIAASGKPQFLDYSQDRVEADQEAYLAAGYPAAEAKTASWCQLPVPQLASMRDLALYMVGVADAYRQAGDETSAQSVLQMADDIGQQYNNYGGAFAGEAQISQFVGMAIEKIALSAMDPNSPYGRNGQTVQDRLNQIAQTKAAGQALYRQAEPLFQKLSSQDWISYSDRSMLFGEEAALQWVVTRYGQK